MSCERVALVSARILAQAVGSVEETIPTGSLFKLFPRILSSSKSSQAPPGGAEMWQASQARGQPVSDYVGLELAGSLEATSQADHEPRPFS